MPYDGIDLPFSFDGLAKIIPALLVCFALAFDVGYFYSIDIGWLSFFTVAEHVEFALRALPMAVAGIIVFLLLFFIHDVVKYAPKTFIEYFRRCKTPRFDARGIVLISAVVAVFGLLIFVLTGPSVCFRGGCNGAEEFREYLLMLVVCATAICVASGVYEMSFKRLAFPELKSIWIGALSGGAIYVGLCLGYYVLFVSLLALAIGTIIYFLLDLITRLVISLG